MTVADSGIAWYISYSGSNNSFDNLSNSVIDGIINRNSYLEVVESVDEELAALATDSESLSDTIDSIEQSIDELQFDESTLSINTPGDDENAVEPENSLVIVDASDSEFILDDDAEANVLELAENIGAIEFTDASHSTFSTAVSITTDIPEEDISELITDDSVAALDVDSIVTATVEEIATDIATQNITSLINPADSDTVIDIDAIADKVADDILKDADIAENQSNTISADNLSEDTEIAIIDTEEKEQIATYTKEEIRELVRSIALSVLHGDKDQDIEIRSVNMEQPHLVRIVDQENEQNVFLFDLRSMITGMQEAKLLDKQINAGSFRISKLAVADQKHGNVDVAALLAEADEQRNKKREERAEHKERLYENARIAARSRLFSF